MEEVHETLGLGPDSPIRWIAAIERDLTVDADRDQLFRILLNVARNAARAMDGRGGECDPERDQIRISGRRQGSVTVIEVADTGPGFSPQGRAHLSEAFQGSTRTGGVGLASRSRQRWCGSTGARSAGSTAPSARRSGSRTRTRRWSSTPVARSGRGREWPGEQRGRARAAVKSRPLPMACRAFSYARPDRAWPGTGCARSSAG